MDDEVDDDEDHEGQDILDHDHSKRAQRCRTTHDPFFVELGERSPLPPHPAGPDEPSSSSDGFGKRTSIALAEQTWVRHRFLGNPPYQVDCLRCGAFCCLPPLPSPDKPCRPYGKPGNQSRREPLTPSDSMGILLLLSLEGVDIEVGETHDSTVKQSDVVVDIHE